MSRASWPRVTALLAAAVLAAGACGSSTKTAATGPPPMAAKVQIVKFTFVPMTVTVKAGGTVTWVQVDSVGHSVQSDNGAWTTSAVLMPGQTFSHTFPKAGTYNYICGVHTYMKGTVRVVG